MSHFRRAFFIVGILGCVALGLAWLQVRAQRVEAGRERAPLRGEWRQLEAEAQTRESEAMQVERAIEEARSMQNATLSPAERARNQVGALIAQIRQRHRLSPPPKRLPLPPSGPRGQVFSELMTNPEYSAAFTRLSQARYVKAKQALTGMGVSDATVGAVVDLLVEKDVAMLDVMDLSGSDTLSSAAVGLAARHQQETLDAEIRSLLGEENYARYEEAQPGSARNLPRTLLSQLEYRLSYSGIPLHAAQVDAIAGAMDRGKNYFKFDLWNNEQFLTQAQQTLTPQQLAGFVELREEYLATAQRAKLPRVEVPPGKSGP